MDKKIFIEREIYFLKGLKEIIIKTKNNLEKEKCIIKNSHYWERMFGYILEHLKYLKKEKFCSEDLKKLKWI